MKKITKNLIIIVVLLSAILMCIYGFSYAKYVSNSVWNYYLKTKGFYFSSDILTQNNSKNVNNLWDGSSTHFTLSNSSNNSLASSYDINYKVECTLTNAPLGSLCYINGLETNYFEGVISSFEACSDKSYTNKTDCEIAGNTWKSQVTFKDMYFDVVNNDTELKDVSVNIKVTTTSPYEKTLSGDFILHKGTNGNGDFSLKYDSLEDYERLVISNSYDDNRCVKLSWNANDLLIDSDDFNLSNSDTNNYINEIIFNINGKDSKKYIFYKRDLNKKIDSSAFTLTQTDGCN